MAVEIEMPLGTRARFHAARPAELELTLSVTMPAAAWRKLSRELPSDGSTAGRFSMMIASMLGQCVAKLETTYESTGYSAATPAPPEEST